MSVMALLFFCSSFVFFRYNYLYVYVRTYESGGDEIWSYVFNKVLICLHVFQVGRAANGTLVLQRHVRKPLDQRALG